MSDVEEQPSDSFQMTDLAERLTGPDRNIVARTILGELDVLRRRIQNQVDGGLAPDEFTHYSSVLKALDAATGVMLLQQTDTSAASA